MSRLLPPRKRDWAPGKTQIGLFIRTSEGDVIQATWREASPEAQAKAVALLLEHFPELKQAQQKAKEGA